MNPASKLRQATTCARVACFAGIVLLQQSNASAAWEPAKGRLMTRWAKDVSPKNALKEYPRPSLERDEWQNLNGLWDYSIALKDASRPERFDGQILVPYPIESALSGVMKTVGEKNRLWYKRSFSVPKKWSGKNIILHFGAVDWEATVLVNGKELGQHRGGYDGFSFDITSALKPDGDQELVVAVWDPTDAGTQPRGKQVNRPNSIWYTSVTGIWQTPWLEPVSGTSIESFHAVPDIDAGVLDLTVQLRGSLQSATVEAVALDGRRQIAKASGNGGTNLKLSIPEAKLWSPDSPNLYNLKLTVRENGKVVDEAKSYFGMRKIALGKDDKGTLRLCLNNKPLFQFGPLDQGWWPDGLYTAPTDEALKYDIEMTKELGFNMARKHVKVEPERWYYWCDKLGLLVWQDMPSGDKYIRPRDPDIKRSETSATEYQTELKAMIDGRRNHPSIVMWVPFNEGWGQFDTERVVKWIKNYDPSRLVDNTSGWSDRGVGDVMDIHVYPGPGAPKIEAGRAGVLGEYGGLGLPVPGHTWQDEKNWGYRSYTNSQALTAAYVALVKKLHPLAGDPGLAAAVYTQTTDVEIEVNGLMTYDRAMVKMDKKAITAANKKLYTPPPPPPVIKTLSPTSQKEGVEWRYTTEKPPGNWSDESFSDESWKTGPGGFGEPSTPGSVVKTRWKTDDIWLRRTFEVPAGFKAHNIQVLIHHDEDAEIYLNGTQIAKFPGHIGAYELAPVSSKAASLLKEGHNVLAVHCHQTTGGQFIDVGLVDVQEQETAATGAPGSASTASKQSEKGGLYVSNRAPLVPSPFMKLPIGSITPKGWLRGQLELEANGMTGHLPEISKWCKFEGNAWASPKGEGHSGWEELPYWLKGYGDLGYVLKDQKIIGEARKWIDGVLSSQEPDGYFGPRANKTSLKGKPDLWPHMVMLNVLQSFYEFSRDERVIPFMTKYFKWLNEQPGQTFANGYWPKIRWGDNIESVHWLYNRTGDAFLLDLGKKIHENMAAWSKDVINWHNVNLSQGFRAPAVYYVQDGDTQFLKAAERNYDKVMGLYGQFPGGGFAGDENCRPGYYDPRQGFETCGIVEFMHSFEMLTKISGDPVWSDRCEDIAFNSFPAALTPDWKGLHYLTCANMVQLDKNNKAPAIENGGTMLSYSPFEGYRCCQHNVSHGWPYFAEELWLATPDRGLCASLYSASEVSAKVANGTQVTISEETDYPFGDTISFKVSTPTPVSFPLHLRIPHWCEKATARINGKAFNLRAKPSSYAVVERTWKSGDVLTLQLPMRVATRTWAKNNNSVSVDYGPLTFSLKIAEKWTRYGKNEKWPEWEVYPTSAWNYGLELTRRDADFEVVRKPGPVPENPFKPETVPIMMKAKARKIPAWTQDKFGLVGKLQMNPARSDEPVETVSLIPMGAARLRITSFPVIGHGSDAHEWIKSSAPPIIASHCFSNDSVEAMIDGLEPKSSNDSSIPRFTWWDHKGTEEWVEWGFPKKRKVSGVEVYWFDDTGKGACRVPKSWTVMYRSGESWKPVESESAFETKLNGYNKVAFKPVEAEGLRLEVKLQPEYSGGILEWKVRD